MKILGIVLIALGTLGMLYGGVKFAYPDKVIDAGPIQVSVTKEKSLPIPPIAGAIAIAAGVGLLLAGKK